MTSREGGFALITSVWALVLVGVVAGAYLAESHHVVRVSSNRNADLQARYAALAGLARAHNTLERLQILRFDPAMRVGLDSRARLTRVWNHLDSAFTGIASGCLGEACYDIQVRDLGTLLNVNLASEEQLRRFFLALGAGYRDADVAAQSVADYPPITQLSELRRVRGLDGWLFDAAVRHLTVEGTGRINLNAAPEPVLAALPGLGPEAAHSLIALRRRGTVFSNVFEVRSRLGPTRAGLDDGLVELMQLAIVEPAEIEVTSTGRYGAHTLRVPMRAVYRRNAERVPLIKLSRLDR